MPVTRSLLVGGLAVKNISRNRILFKGYNVLKGYDVDSNFRLHLSGENRPGALSDCLYPPRQGAHRNYDIHPDGQRFLMIKRGDQTEETSGRREIIIVQNWLEELKRLVPKE